jgi:catalase
MVDPSQAIDRINRIYGRHPGHRALHARGTFYTGTFTASSEASRLTRAEAFSGKPVPVLVRLSNAAGNPHQSDEKQDLRGMAVKFQAPGGDTDLVSQTAPRIPVRTVEDFLDFTRVSRKPFAFPKWLLRHLSSIPALRVGSRAKALGPPNSYAEIAYYPIHAYGWVAGDGARTWVRYVWVPLASNDDRPDGTFKGKDRLREEMAARLKKGPVEFDLLVTKAAPHDDPHDPMSAWRGAGDFSAGKLVIQKAVADPERKGGGPVVFDPSRVVDGIELSDDPLLLFRPKAYAESAARRAASPE